MRVLVATDAVGGLTASGASEIIATAFAAAGAQVAVVALATSGPQLAESFAQADPGVSLAAPADERALSDLLHTAEGSLVLDLTGLTVENLGRAVLGGDPVEGLARLRSRWAGRDLVALVAPGEVGLALTGLSGLAATQGRAAGLDLAGVLAADAEAERFASLLGLTPAPGSGAAGGVGLVIQALGGRVADPLSELSSRFGLAATAAAADVVVTGADTLDFHSVGGPVVKHVVGAAGAALRPVIAVSGRNYISARELRLAGIESAYAVASAPGEAAVDAESLAHTAALVASTWRW